jgi:chromosomal replication initiation ATPase DnaA
MDTLAEIYNRFPFSTHPLPTPPERDSVQLIETLERALHEVATLQEYVSPLVGFAQQALNDFRRVHASGRLSAISAYVAYKLGITHEQLMSKSRTQRTAFCRQVAMYICRSVSGASFPAIGEHFHRDHSSVIHAVRLIDKRINNDPTFRWTLQRIEADLGHIAPPVAAAA